MTKVVKRTLIAASLLAAGAILGPVVIAAIGAALAANSNASPMHPRSEANLLVEAYRQRLPVGFLFMTVVMPENGKECGYDSEQVFPKSFDQLGASFRQRVFSDYAGYWVLDHWRNESRDKEWLYAVTNRIDEDMSEFQAGFLRRCIESTLFSPVCMSRVAPYGDSVERSDHKRPASPQLGFGIENQIICTYVDGVAARHGIKVPSVRN